MNIVRNTYQVVEKMDVIQMDIGVLEDGIYHPNILGLEIKYLIMAKDRRGVGRFIINTVESYYPVYLIQVCVKDNKTIE